MHQMCINIAATPPHTKNFIEYRYNTTKMADAGGKIKPSRTTNFSSRCTH